jgi:hypothetical protein
MAQVTAVLTTFSTKYDMTINYDAAADTVRVTVDSKHGGAWFPQPNNSCVGGTMQEIPRRNIDVYRPPSSPPPDGGGGGDEETGPSDTGTDTEGRRCYKLEKDWYLFDPNTGETVYLYTETQEWCEYLL